MKPTIREARSFDIYSCPQVPTYEAGYLVEGNGSWRSSRPVVEIDKCTGCLQCYLYCPDGAISKLDTGEKRPKVLVEYDFCKGCGICVKMCRFNCLKMEEEPRD